MSAVTTPSGRVVARVEDAHQVLSVAPNQIVGDLKALLAHPITVVANFALYELKARGAI